MFDARGLTRGISLVLTGAVEVRFQDERIAADTAEKRMAALASITFGEDGAALPATEAEEIASVRTRTRPDGCMKREGQKPWPDREAPSAGPPPPGSAITSAWR